MGISWSSSSRRRDNYYHQNPNPPSQLISSSSSSSSYPYPSDPYPAPPTSYPYPTHPPPPPPPPTIHSSYYYSSGGGYGHGHGHGACNYANAPWMGGRPNLGPNNINYATYQTNNGWPPPLFLGPPPPPPPYLDHQQAKKVKNDVNVHKDTLWLEIDEHNPDHHLISFVFDALYDGSITIFYFAKEEGNCRFVSVLPEAFVPVKIPFQKGPSQKFRQPSGTGIDLGFFALEELSKQSPGEDVFPLVISAETCSPSLSSEECSRDSPPNSSNMQITQAVIEKNKDDHFQVRVVRQLLWIGGVRYELRDIYGIGNSASASFNDSDSGKECVICMTEPKDTAVLPCRHMCMCGECAKALRLQSNKCPICRQPIEELMEIKIDSVDE